jgi:hypothetical protein
MFSYFCFQRHNFCPIPKSYSEFEAHFWYLTFVEETFSGNQNGGLAQDGEIFGKKSTFL